MVIAVFHVERRRSRMPKRPAPARVAESPPRRVVVITANWRVSTSPAVVCSHCSACVVTAGAASRWHSR